MTGVPIARADADRGNEGHDDKGLTPTVTRELKRRSAIEPMIGHAKNDGRLGRNDLLGHDGARINALPAAAGCNLRLTHNAPVPLLARIPAAFCLLSLRRQSQNRILGRSAGLPGLSSRA